MLAVEPADEWQANKPVQPTRAAKPIEKRDVSRGGPRG
jgi:hypothetical protein